MKNVNKTKKKSFLFRMVTMMMAALTLAITMALPVSASAIEVPAAVSTVEFTQLLAADNSNAEVMNAAIPNLNLIAVTDLDSQTDGDDQFAAVVAFFVKWIKRVGLLVAFVGGVMFALAIKNNDAEQKQAGLLTLVAGFVVAALCGAVNMFGII